MSPEVAQRTVVIIDDDPAVRGALTFSLQTEGFLVRSYASGADLLADVPVSDESCLVIDYQLPGMNGFGAAGGAAPSRDSCASHSYHNSSECHGS
jgi:FixJ family two-component response regulator